MFNEGQQELVWNGAAENHPASRVRLSAIFRRRASAPCSAQVRLEPLRGELEYLGGSTREGLST